MRKTIRRDWLKKQIEKGNIEIKCNGIYTDDYAYDYETNCQRSDWQLANINNFEAHDFKYETGYAYMHEDGTIRWTMLANHYYECRLINNTL